MAEKQTVTQNNNSTSGRIGQLRDLVGIMIVLASLFVFLSLIFHRAPDYSMQSPQATNKTGEIGAMVAQELLFSLGYGAYLFAGITLFFGSMIFLRIQGTSLFQKITSACLFLVASLVLGALVTPENFRSHLMIGFGGSYGRFILDQMVPYVGRLGAYMGVGLAYISTLFLGSRLRVYPFVTTVLKYVRQEAADVKPEMSSPADIGEKMIRWGVTLIFLPIRGVRFIAGLCRNAVQAGILKTQSGMNDMMEKRREVYEQLLKDRENVKEKRKQQRRERDLGHTPAPPDGAVGDNAASEPSQNSIPTSGETEKQSESPLSGEAATAQKTVEEPSTVPTPSGETGPEPVEEADQNAPANQPSNPTTSTDKPSPETGDETNGASGDSEGRSILAPEVEQDYELPPLSLLTQPETGVNQMDRTQIKKKKEVIQETLDNFNIDGKVVNSSTGPVITMYEIELAPGVQVSKLTRCSDDLAISLKAPSVRIVYPIPGKSTVGIEVPKGDRGLVRVRELWENVGNKATDYRIPLLLGRSAEGDPVHIDLADMPHLLVAGTTGSGKSVCLKNIIVGQLLCRTPRELKLLMVDPKRVELTRFEGIPHLISPIIKNMRKVTEAFEWLVDYMEERYKLLQLTGCTDLDEFNALSEQEAKSRLKQKGKDPELYPGYQPRILALVDELGDLMSVSSKEVETTVTRIAQKARAVGIHMILSTQRPSSEVITGLIKSNLPARISFKVMSGSNSRIIIDQNGAEDLIGDGDMLLSLPDREQPIRAQGALIEEDEIQRVCSYWKDEAGKLRNESLPDIPKVEEGMSAKEREMKDNLDERQKENEEQPDDTTEDEKGTSQVDEKFEDAVDVVVAADRGSVSLIQRKLQIGYTRASRIMEQMAEEGLVGPHRGNKPREVLIDEDEWRKLKQDGQML